MNLTKQALLQTAQEKSWTSEFIFKIGKSLTSVESITAFTKKLEAKQTANEKAQKRWEILLALSVLTMIIGGLALIAAIPLGFYETTFWKELAKSGWGALLMFSPLLCAVPLTVGIARGNAIDKKDRQLAWELRTLQPIRGTDVCQEALRYIESGYKEVMSWRDLAMAERGQLYVFDVAVMSDLHAVARQRQEQEQAQARSDAACKAVHGIGAGSSNDYAAV